jgi:nucleotide-binding universal stress UspA family protein
MESIMNQVVQTSGASTVDRQKRTVGYKDVLVHLDGTTEDEVRIAHAEALAVRFQAHLTGIYTNVLPDVGLYAGEFGGAVIGDLTDEASREGDATQARLIQRFSRLGVPNDIRRVENIAALIDRMVATEARWGDLFVGSCPSGTAELERWSALIETVMFEGGHGLYLVPRGLKLRQELRTVLVGWVDTREAARAVAEALPLLGHASQVYLASVQEPDRGRLGGAEILADIAAHLDRHGITTTVSLLPDRDTPAAMLLAEAHRVSADMIVTGAYGHTRLREWILGGATSDLLQTSDLPILMAH